jgi:rhodanese-related sulfurtransferase
MASARPAAGITAETGDRREAQEGVRPAGRRAKARIRTLTLTEARARHGRDDVVFVELRDVRELEREGMIPGAFHCPRGMLEFWIDPGSPYFKDVFGSGKEFVFYCNGAWRSVLAADTAQQMGLEAISHLRRGLALLKTLPDSPEHARRELALLIALGVPLRATKGFGAPEVGEAYSRALEL